MNISNVIAQLPKCSTSEYKNIHYILVEGGIGVGKSSLCLKFVEILSKMGYNVKYIPEKINKPLLSSYLKDPTTKALAFQLYMIVQRMAAIKEHLRYNQEETLYIVVDRSIFGDLIFGKVNWIMGNITEDDFKLYIDTVLNDCIIPNNVHVIYLKCDVETCIRRIRKRNRLSEATDYDVKYLMHLHEKHDDVLDKPDNIVVDWSEDVTDIGNKATELLNIIIKDKD